MAGTRQMVPWACRAREFLRVFNGLLVTHAGLPGELDLHPDFFNWFRLLLASGA
jgi:hypothetical protein